MAVTTRSILVLALAGTALAVSACSGSAEVAGSSEPASEPAVTTEQPVADPGSSAAAQDPVGSDAATPGGTGGSASIPKPSAADMPTDRLADAVLEQLKIDSPDTFSDQLITIALSPLMRQFSSTADVTTRVASKGEKVTFTISGEDGTCVITVTDEPRARGVVCKTV